MTELRLVVPAGGGGRVDRFAADLSGLSRSRIQHLITEGRVTADGNPVKANTVVPPGAVLVIDVPPVVSAGIEPEAIPLDVVYEDDEVLVVDKPAGLVVHPSPGHWSGTLVNALLARDTVYGGIAGVERPGIVHRLDRDTSGVMVVARTGAAREGLMKHFAKHDIERAYLAIVEGTPSVRSFDTLHGRHPSDRKRFTTRVTRGKRAITHVQVVERLGAASLVRCTLETGRTHQIRVHLAEHGTPLLADPIYGRAPRDPSLREIAAALGRHALHAAVLGFVHPITGAGMRFETPLPADMQSALDALRAKA
jgi:23S rRNA pseudouridine1911/1915/1917 synthase